MITPLSNGRHRLCAQSTDCKTSQGEDESRLHGIKLTHYQMPLPPKKIEGEPHKILSFVKIISYVAGAGQGGS
jgi:hypothetical protein